MIAALLLAAAAPVTTAVDAELAFARDAQRIGQWTAFRKWADRDAVVFTPQAAWAREAFPKQDPPRAITWRPAHSFVSCDGRTAVNTGPWFNLQGRTAAISRPSGSARPRAGAGPMTAAARLPRVRRSRR